MSHVFHRQARHHYPVAVRGAGAFIEDSAGKRYLDASGGAAVSCLGHDHPHVVAAIKDQLERLPFARTAHQLRAIAFVSLLRQVTQAATGLIGGFGRTVTAIKASV